MRGVPVRFAVGGGTAPGIIAAGAAAHVAEDGRFVAERSGLYTVVATTGRHSAASTISIGRRDVRREVEVVGRGRVLDRHTSDLWIWEGTDGRDYAITGTWGADGHAYIWDVTDPADIERLHEVKVDARTVNDVKVSEDGDVAVISREGASDRRNGIVVLGVGNPREGGAGAVRVHRPAHRRGPQRVHRRRPRLRPERRPALRRHRHRGPPQSRAAWGGSSWTPPATASTTSGSATAWRSRPTGPTGSWPSTSAAGAGAGRRSSRWSWAATRTPVDGTTPPSRIGAGPPVSSTCSPATRRFPTVATATSAAAPPRARRGGSTSSTGATGTIRRRWPATRCPRRARTTSGSRTTCCTPPSTTGGSGSSTSPES